MGASYLDQPATLPADELWAELAADHAKPSAHTVPGGNPDRVVCVHVLGKPDLCFAAGDLHEALCGAVRAWRRAKVAAAIANGLLAGWDEAEAQPAATVRLYADAAYALTELSDAG